MQDLIRGKHSKGYEAKFPEFIIKISKSMKQNFRIYNREANFRNITGIFGTKKKTKIQVGT